jgi:NitT/TauT family transport system permease protein
VSARLPVWGLRALIVIVVVAAWQVSISAHVFSTFSVSPPAQVLSQVGAWISDGSIWRSIGGTLLTFAVGYVIGVGAGILLGLGGGLSPAFRQYLAPFMTFFNAIPKLVLIPFFIAWLGFGGTPGVIVVALVIVFVVAITVQTGITEVQGRFIENSRMLGASRLDVLREVYLPATGIWVMTSARLSIGLGFQAAVVSEFLGSGKGLGFLIVHGQQVFAAQEIFGAIAVTVILALVIDSLLSLADRRVSRWIPRQA